jgi:hypothetical protein
VETVLDARPICDQAGIAPRLEIAYPWRSHGQRNGCARPSPRDEEETMTRLLLSVMVFATGVTRSPASAQKTENAPTFIKAVERADVKARYLDFKWDQEAFEALEKGGDLPAAKRSWVIARLYPSKPIQIDGKTISGGNLLILNPARDDTPMTFEVRVIDMREVWVDPNVIAEPPPGRTLYLKPARFEKTGTVADRLTLALSEGDGKVKLSIHYGDRLAELEFVR